MMGETETKEISIILQPDLLGKEELIDILSPRCFSTELKSLDKYELVELFNRVVLPLPQRQYKASWRGTKLNEKRKQQEALKPKAPTSDSESPSKNSGKKQHNGTGRNLIYKPLTDLNSKLKCTTLDTPPSKVKDPPKPLPDQINYERKTIKLSGIRSSNTKSDVDNLVIKKRKGDVSSQDASSSPDKSTSCPEKIRRRISYNSDESSPSTGATKDGSAPKETSNRVNAVQAGARKRPLITAPDSTPVDKYSSSKKSKKKYSR